MKESEEEIDADERRWANAKKAGEDEKNGSTPHASGFEDHGENAEVAAQTNTNTGQQTQKGENAPNSVYSLRDGSTVDWQNLYAEWKSGTGPEYSLFVGSGKMIDRLKGSKFENAALKEFYKNGGKKAVQMTLKWTAFTAISDFLTIPNMSEQFLGSVRVRVEPIGNQLRITLDNTTNQTSYYAHTKQSNPPRESGKIIPESTIYQRIIWYVEREK